LVSSNHKLFFMKKPSHIFPIVLLGLMLSFCSERAEWHGETENLSVHDKMAVDLAKSVARSVDLEPVRKFLKDEAALRFDGDYDILLQEVRHKPVADLSAAGRGTSLTFGEVLFGAAPDHAGRTAQGATGQTLLDSLGAMYPLMQIAIPELRSQTVEDWDVAKQKPLVAVMPEDYQEGKTKTLRAYDADGRVHMVDAENEPDKLVIVISHNERLIAVPRGSGPPDRGRTNSGCMVPHFSSETHDYFWIYDPACGGMHGTEDWSPGGVGAAAPIVRSNCHRAFDINLHEFLQGIYFTSGAWQHEWWPSGAPEIDIRLVVPDMATNFRSLKVDPNQGLIGLKPNRRRDIDQRWWPVEKQIFLWDTVHVGEVVAYQFTEADGGPVEKKVKVGGTFVVKKVPIPLSIEFKVGNRDDPMGSEIVNYCSRPHRIIDGYECYDLANVYFRVNQLTIPR
jgi:hypothetical protein